MVPLTFFLQITLPADGITMYVLQCSVRVCMCSVCVLRARMCARACGYACSVCVCSRVRTPCAHLCTCVGVRVLSVHVLPVRVCELRVHTCPCAPCV